MVSQNSPSSRLLIVSNRLPVTILKKNDILVFEESLSGLATAIGAYLRSLKSSYPGDNYIWIGWPGTVVDTETRMEVILKLSTTFNAYPVFLSQEDIDDFYLGFCNKVIWPLFHYFPSYVEYSDTFWARYQTVNQIYCNTVMEIIRPGDVVWIHDYHLMLLPRLLRQKLPDTAIGFTLHIPFPSPELFRLLPEKWSAHILESLLQADLLGFHTHEYAQQFLSSIFHILGYDHYMGQVTMCNHLVKVATFPAGVDFQSFWKAHENPEVQKVKVELKKRLTGVKVILSLDRLDYTKGIVNRLNGFEIFLNRYSEWHRKVVLLMVVAPSRIEIEQYQRTQKQIEELVERINGIFGTADWKPIIYHFKSLPFQTVAALYSVSDICLVSSLRDGMPAIPKEYVASRIDGSGVLILSEMTGAARELREAIMINPNSFEAIAGALKEALEMPEAEQVMRNRLMQVHLQRYDVVNWAQKFFQELYATKALQISN